jgi:chorismate lyase/3-hydroxybenzoate synthase
MTSVTHRVLAAPLTPVPPRWVGDVTAGTGRFLIVSRAIAGATSLDARQLADAVAGAYRELAAELGRRERYAVRIWNFVPDIQGPLDGADRYQAFNAGRFAAYCDWFGGAGTFAGWLPTASAVGVRGTDLSIHVLAADAPGRAIENPRQRPAYRYSRRYGARPPCFSRATRFDALLLLGGTASILDEDSRHMDDLEAQLRETCRNLSVLVEAGATGPVRDPLRTIRNLRVYVREAHHASDVRSLLDEIVPDVSDVELVQAPLCRRELLVEIEGVAILPD